MIETLRIVTIEKPGLKFLLILKFHGKIDLHTELTSGTSIILFESKTEKKSIKIVTSLLKIRDVITKRHPASYPSENDGSKSNVFFSCRKQCEFKVACRVQIWIKTFYQNSDKFSYSFIKNDIMFMYTYFVFRKKTF